MVARRHKRKSQLVCAGDGPTVERRNHDKIVTEVLDRDNEGKALICRYKVVGDIPVEAYYLRGKISEDEYKAGIKFRNAYLRAVLRVRVEDNNSGCHGDPEMALLTPIYSEIILREAYNVLSAAQKKIIIFVCGHDEWAGGKVNLKTLHRGLEKLAILWKNT